MALTPEPQNSSPPSVSANPYVCPSLLEDLSRIPYNLTYMWNLMNKKKNRNRIIDTENRLTALIGEEV